MLFSAITRLHMQVKRRRKKRKTKQRSLIIIIISTFSDLTRLKCNNDMRHSRVLFSRCDVLPCWCTSHKQRWWTPRSSRSWSNVVYVWRRWSLRPSKMNLELMVWDVFVYPARGKVGGSPITINDFIKPHGDPSCSCWEIFHCGLTDWHFHRAMLLVQH